MIVYIRFCAFYITLGIMVKRLHCGNVVEVHYRKQELHLLILLKVEQEINACREQEKITLQAQFEQEKITLQNEFELKLEASNVNHSCEIEALQQQISELKQKGMMLCIIRSM